MPEDHSIARLALDNCDREPIHTPGVIQPFGGMIACDLRLRRIEYVSGNIQGFTGKRPEELLGQSAAELLGRELSHELRNALAASTSKVQRERVGTYALNGRELDIYCHWNPQDLVVLELEEVPELKRNQMVAIDRVRALLSQITARSRLEDMLRFAVTGLHQITGYDRVKAYKFEDNGDGEVVAEFCVPGVESFLGLRYPAWDIPQQARALQIKSPLRIMPDRDHTPEPILAAAPGAEPLDISLAHVRGVSPVHLEYLRNMGVVGTLSLGIVVEGELWGMFALHHYTTKPVDADTRMACELFAQMFSLIVHKMTELRRAEARQKATVARQALISQIDRETDLLDSFDALAPVLSQVIDCDGIAVVRERDIRFSGDTPTRAAMLRLAGMRSDEEDLILASGELKALQALKAEDLDGSAGMLLVRATAAFPLQLMFFRNETLQRLKWAGKPQKAISSGPNGPRLTPRGSFEAFAELRRDQSDPWSDEDQAAAREIQILLTQISARGERSEMRNHKALVSQQRQQDLLIAELNHRVKNILALVKSLTSQARRSARTLEEYTAALDDRISALADAHDLAVSNSLKGVPLRAILETEMRPYIMEQRGQVLLDGPLVGLRADVAPVLSLVIHELVTNATKYGALSVSEGLVRVIWKLTPEGLELAWREIGGPEVHEPTSRGFGRSLIDQAIPYEFDGRAELTFARSGLKFDCFLPADTLAEAEDLVSETDTAPSDASVKDLVKGTRALLVEDNVVLAMDAAENLRHLGCAAVESVSSVPAAMSILKRQSFDLAVLDLNLRGSTSFPIAEVLQEAGIPFLFVTGYGAEAERPDALADVPLLTKPLNTARLTEGLGRILAKGRAAPGTDRGGALARSSDQSRSAVAQEIFSRSSGRRRCSASKVLIRWWNFSFCTATWARRA